MSHDASLPPLLMTSEPNSFCRKTIVERKPQILREVGQAHPYPVDIQEALVSFADEIASGTIQPLHEDAPDVAPWNSEWSRFEGQSWLDVPWYFAESFFYRRLIEIIRFYQPGPWQHVDPFAPQKAAQLQNMLPSFLSVLEHTFTDPEAAFIELLHDALWGNRADLSNRTITELAADGLAGQQAHRLLIDDTPLIWATLRGDTPGRIDIVADNCGLELLLDLRLAAFLLESGIAQEVRFHLKRMPFFVSDATIPDLEHTLERLSQSTEPGAALAAGLRKAIVEERMTLHDDPFWSSCFSYHHMPSPVRQELAGSRLVLFKGDVNYRRLLDDRHWPHTAHLADIAAHLAPFAALRTLKGELIVDLEPGQAKQLAAVDPTWMINGKRGVIQLVKREA